MPPSTSTSTTSGCCNSHSIGRSSRSATLPTTVYSGLASRQPASASLNSRRGERSATRIMYTYPLRLALLPVTHTLWYCDHVLQQALGGLIWSSPRKPLPEQEKWAGPT